MKIVKKICLPILILLSQTTAAQKMLTLDEAIATALQNNYNIQLSKNDSAVAALDYSYRNAAFLPSVNANLSGLYRNNNQNQKFSDGTQRKLNDIRSNNYAASVDLNWVIFDGLKMFATRDKLKEIVQLGSLEIKQQIVSTIADVITNYYAIVKQKQQLKAIDEQINLNKERVKLAAYKLDIGVGAKPDVLQSKVDLNAQKAAYLNEETKMAKLRETLNQIINIKPGTNYVVSDTILIDMNVSLGDIQQGLDTQNPDLLLAQKNIDIAKLILKERKADLFPTVSLSAGYDFNRTNNKA
ncbi:MAG TPA: TolC family protein, partial [Chitinophagaceae bacterium]|nr:TolC family protein [Chitinophagaceae bacterium]